MSRYARRRGIRSVRCCRFDRRARSRVTPGHHRCRYIPSHPFPAKGCRSLRCSRVAARQHRKAMEINIVRKQNAKSGRKCAVPASTSEARSDNEEAGKRNREEEKQQHSVPTQQEARRAVAEAPQQNAAEAKKRTEAAETRPVRAGVYGARMRRAAGIERTTAAGRRQRSRGCKTGSPAGRCCSAKQAELFTRSLSHHAAVAPVRERRRPRPREPNGGKSPGAAARRW